MKTIISCVAIFCFLIFSFKSDNQERKIVKKPVKQELVYQPLHLPNEQLLSELKSLHNKTTVLDKKVKDLEKELVKNNLNKRKKNFFTRTIKKLK